MMLMALSLSMNIHAHTHIPQCSLQHIDTPFNNMNTPFDFTPEMYERVYKILAKYPAYGKQSAILPLMYLAQEQCGGWVPLAAMNKIAEIVEQPPKKVYEVSYRLTNFLCHYFFIISLLFYFHFVIIVCVDALYVCVVIFSLTYITRSFISNVCWVWVCDNRSLRFTPCTTDNL